MLFEVSHGFAAGAVAVDRGVELVELVELVKLVMSESASAAPSEPSWMLGVETVMAF